MGQELQPKEVALQGGEQQSTWPKDAVIEEVYSGSSETGKVQERDPWGC